MAHAAIIPVYHHNRPRPRVSSVPRPHGMGPIEVGDKAARHTNLSSCSQVGVNTLKWDCHPEMQSAIDEYRTRRLKAASFMQWAGVCSAHKVPEIWVHVLEAEVEDLRQELGTERLKVHELDSINSRKQVDSAIIPDSTRRALHALQLKLETIEASHIEAERNAFFFFEEELTRLAEELKAASKSQGLPPRTVHQEVRATQPPVLAAHHMISPPECPTLCCSALY